GHPWVDDSAMPGKDRTGNGSPLWCKYTPGVNPSAHLRLGAGVTVRSSRCSAACAVNKLSSGRRICRNHYLIDTSTASSLALPCEERRRLSSSPRCQYCGLFRVRSHMQHILLIEDYRDNREVTELIL